LAALLAGGFVISSAVVCMCPSVGNYWLALGDMSTIALAVITARRNVVLAILLYQRYAPEHVRGRCAMTPSCSEYALLAIDRYGLLRGATMVWSRLRHRCDGTPVVDYP